MAESREDKTLVHSNPTQRLAVYRLQDERGQLRCLREHTFSNNTDCQQEVERFHLMQRLSHPNICQVRRVEETEVSIDWLLRVEMEWCGQDLESLTRSKYPQGWGEDRAAQVFVDVLAALTHAQEQGVCHRDVKPSNLYETATGYKVADFGKASDSLGYAMTGTPLFLSPILRRAFTQALLGEAVSHVGHNPFKSDVYSLGLTLVYLLQPSALNKLGNQTELAKVISALPIRPSLRDTLHLMLAYEEANRPDFIELAEHMRQLQSPAKEEGQVPAMPSIKRPRARVLKKAQAADQSQALPVPVPSTLQTCHACMREFALDRSQPWRLELLGSSQGSAAAHFCSFVCFQQSYTESPRSEPSISDLSPMRTHTTTIVSAKPVTENHYRQFLHCNRHVAVLPGRGRTFWSTATILAQCPQCDAGLVTREELPQLSRWIERNSLYPSLVFFGGFAAGRVAYIVLSSAAAPTLRAAACHFCTCLVQPACWLLFPHNNNLALVCSMDCLVEATSGPSCPTCNTWIPPEFGRVFPKVGGVFMTSPNDTTVCPLCWCGKSEYMLLCGHGFCKNCLRYIPEDSDMFSCLVCGQILLRSDHTDLFGVRDSA